MLIICRKLKQTKCFSLQQLASLTASPVNIAERQLYLLSVRKNQQQQNMSGRRGGYNGGGPNGRFGGGGPNNGRMGGGPGPFSGGYNHNGFNGGSGYGPYHNGPRNYGGGGGDFGNNSNFDLPNNINGNDLMKLMTAMASNFNMNPPPPPPVRMCCGDLRPHHAGMHVELSGRLVKKRVTRFVELRDRNGGAVQMVILEDKHPRVARRLYNMPENSMLTIVGTVMRRPTNSCNQTMPTGDVEVEIEDIVNLGLPPAGKRVGDKRTYSTMAQQNSCGITSTEYKIAKSENILKYFENRDLTCNSLRREDIGRVVTLVGWIPQTKNSKFMQLKDGYGHTQIVIEDKALQDTCLTAPEGTVIQVTGKVLGRPRANINMKYETGEVEVLVENIKILNPDDVYDGPIKIKEKVQKMSIDDLDAEHTEEDSTARTVNNGEIKTDNAANVLKIADVNKFTCRTHSCGELTVTNVGEKVILVGWLEFQRMNKFFVLRDGYGQTQVLLTDKVKGMVTENLSLESIIRVEGTVIPRPTATVNEQMKTGEIEVEAEKLEVLNHAKKNLPFEIRKFNRANERLRLQHRYLDLRFPDMQHNLRMRSAVLMRMREYLINYLGFVEVETPTLFRRTPGGAQEFVVPTRKPGHFYSLVQSPQQFKQMLMAGAIDRYFQVARCYRDEATRPDRQPEFTQFDIEMSFTTRDKIMQLVEEVLRYSWPKEFRKIQTPFPRMTYKDAMENYGTDKPDTRFGFELTNVTEYIEKNKTLVEKYQKLGAYALIVRGNEAFWNNSARNYFQKLGKEFTGTLFVRKFTQYKHILESLTNLLGVDVGREFKDKFGLEENDVLFLAIGETDAALNIMGRVRVDYYNFLLENKRAKKNYENKFVWIIDFPLFLKNSETNAWESVHHPFTAPHFDDMNKFVNAKKNELAEVRSQAYDLVLNGQEIAGGSMRIHDRDMQHFVLEQILNLPHEHLDHLLAALESGCPPHGGIALGIDRLLAIMCRARSIRDVIAFPKSLNGRDPLSQAPVPISDEEKSLYHIAIVENVNAVETTHAEEDDDPEAERAAPSPVQNETEQDVSMRDVTEKVTEPTPIEEIVIKTEQV